MPLVGRISGCEDVVIGFYKKKTKIRRLKPWKTVSFSMSGRTGGESLLIDLHVLVLCEEVCSIWNSQRINVYDKE